MECSALETLRIGLAVPCGQRPLCRRNGLSSLREKLREMFELISEGMAWTSSYHRLVRLHIVLMRYGRALYQAGRPYSDHAETVNALSGRPLSRRGHSFSVA